MPTSRDPIGETPLTMTALPALLTLPALLALSTTERTERTERIDVYGISTSAAVRE